MHGFIFPNLVLDFLNIIIISYSSLEIFLPKPKSNKFLRTNLTKYKRTFCPPRSSTFWDLIRANRIKTFWDETFAVTENHQKKKGSKMHLKIWYLLRKNLLRSRCCHPHHDFFFFLKENSVLRTVFYRKHWKEKIKKVLKNTRKNTQLHYTTHTIII